MIEGNDIEFSGGGNTRDHGIYLHKGQNVTVINNKVVGTSGYGIHLYDEHKSSDPAVWRSHPFKMGPYLIEGNTIERSRLRSGLIVAKGRGGEFINLSDISILNNVFRNNKDLGVLIRNGVNVSVTDNKFFNDGLIANVPITRSGNIFNGSEPPNSEPPGDKDPPPPGEGDKDPPPTDPPPSEIIVVEDDKFKITIERKNK